MEKKDSKMLKTDFIQWTSLKVPVGWMKYTTHNLETLYVRVQIGKLDPILISYKLTTNVSVTYKRIQQYPVNTIYNILGKKYCPHLG